MTTLAVSNIAWSYGNRLDAYAILRDHGFGGLEIAPGLLFAEEATPFTPSSAGVSARLAELEKAGLRLVSMQSLLFGVEGAEVFGPPAAVERLKHGLTQAILLAGRLGIPNLVFGSPRQRVVPPDFDVAEQIERMRAVFRPLGDLAAANGTVLAMEPNPAEYGANFMTNFPDTLEVVKAIAHPAITLNFDLGALHMTNALDKIDAYIAASAPHLSHVHLSAPFLGPAPASVEEAAGVLQSLAGIGYSGAVSIEMKAVVDDELGAVATAAARLCSALPAHGAAE
jgi:sugar phosphate isomerase/epimerase